MAQVLSLLKKDRLLDISILPKQGFLDILITLYGEMITKIVR